VAVADAVVCLADEGLTIFILAQLELTPIRVFARRDLEHRVTLFGPAAAAGHILGEKTRNVQRRQSAITSVAAGTPIAAVLSPAAVVRQQLVYTDRRIRPAIVLANGLDSAKYEVRSLVLLPGNVVLTDARDVVD
jgi:hypothetical protein